MNSITEDEMIRYKQKRMRNNGSISWKCPEIAKRDGGYFCFYCKCQLDFLADSGPEADHKIPRSRGGSNHLDNLVLSCRSCNTKKGARTTEEYLAGEYPKRVYFKPNAQLSEPAYGVDYAPGAKREIMELVERAMKHPDCPNRIAVEASRPAYNNHNI